MCQHATSNILGERVLCAQDTIVLCVVTLILSSIHNHCRYMCKYKTIE